MTHLPTHRRRDPARRRGAPSTYARRRERMDSLIGELIREEYDAGRSLAARAVLADAIAEAGNVPLADRLSRWPRDRKLYGTPLLRKVEAFVRGPSQRSSLAPRPQRRRILLALLGGRRPTERRWVQIDRSVGGPHDGRPYVVEMGQGYSSYYGLVWAGGIEDAYEAAQEAFPFHFFRELDEDEDPDLLEGLVREHPDRPGVFMVEDEEARYQTAIASALRVGSARRLGPYDRHAVLRSGEIVEFVS